MPKNFGPADLDQPKLLPSDLRARLLEGHLAVLLSDVVDMLGLACISHIFETAFRRGGPA